MKRFGGAGFQPVLEQPRAAVLPKLLELFKKKIFGARCRESPASL
jgi:hypothetical protein